MTHFAIVCPAVTGHLNPMFVLGRELQRRGHRVTFLGVLDAQATTLAAGLEFRAIGQRPRFAIAEELKLTEVDSKLTNLKEITLHMILGRRQNFKFSQSRGNGQ
ncbi:glycosyltransferase [Nostoc sp. FACHB-892]